MKSNTEKPLLIELQKIKQFESDLKEIESDRNQIDSIIEIEKRMFAKQMFEIDFDKKKKKKTFLQKLKNLFTND